MQRGELVGGSQAACGQQRGGDVEGSGPARRAQAQASVDTLERQRQAPQSAFDIQSQVSHQCEGVAIGAQQQVLAIVQWRLEAMGALDPPRAASKGAGRFEHRDGMAGSGQVHERRQPRPSGADDGDVQRDICRCSARPPVT